MRALALALLCSSCAADRWFGSVSRGDGEISGDAKGFDYDTEEYRVELGLSGPIGAQPRTERRAPPPPTPLPIEKPAPTPQPAAPSPESRIPWMEIVTYGAGVLTSEGARRGVKHYKSRRST